jgi:hypothetical protein
MPVLPLIDFLILLGWTSLIAGFVEKTIYLATAYRPRLLGLTPLDLLLVAFALLLLALTLAARTWVKLHEPRLLALQRRADADRVLARVRAEEGAGAELEGAPAFAASREQARR